METNKAERLEHAVATLGELIELAEGCGLRESAQFLAMAKLHLQIDLNDAGKQHCDGDRGPSQRYPP